MVLIAVSTVQRSTATLVLKYYLQLYVCNIADLFFPYGHGRRDFNDSGRVVAPGLIGRWQNYITTSHENNIPSNNTNKPHIIQKSRIRIKTMK
jgi:hypothetical protein